MIALYLMSALNDLFGIRCWAVSIDHDDQVKNLTLSIGQKKNVKLSPCMDFEPFWPDDLEWLWIGYLIDGCPAINCASMAQENLMVKYK